MSTTSDAGKQLRTLSFPQKLWLLMNRKYRTSSDNNNNPSATTTSSSNCSEITTNPLVNLTNNVCKWSRNGTAIRVRIDRLDEFLATAGARSLFRCRRSGQWLRQLVAYGFQRIGDSGNNASGSISRANLLAMASAVAGSGQAASTPNLDMEVHEYRHESFRRDQPQRIDAIKWQQPLSSNPSSANADQQQRVAVQMLRRPRLLRRRRRSAGWPDPCTRILRSSAATTATTVAAGSTTPRLCVARLRLRTVLRMVAVRSMLHAKLEHCARTDDWSMELQADVYENAADSVSAFERRDVAGFYGRNVSVAAVRTFFGEYLPTYAANGQAADADGSVGLVEAQQLQQQQLSFEAKPEVCADGGETVPFNAETTTTGDVIVADNCQPNGPAIAQFQIRHDAGEFSVHKLDSTTTTTATSKSLINATTSDSNNLLATISSDYGARALVNRNQFTPIDYDTSFMDNVAMEDDLPPRPLSSDNCAAPATNAAQPQVEYEFILGYPSAFEQTQNQTQQQQQHVQQFELVVDDAGGVNFEQFFQMKPIGGSNDAAMADAEPKMGVANSSDANGMNNAANGDGDGDNFGVGEDDGVDPLDAELLAMQQDIDRTLSEVIKTEAEELGQQTSMTTATSTASASTSTEDILQEAALIDDDFYSQLRESMDVLYD